MKNCLDTRKLDELGRIVIPMGVRKKLGAEKNNVLAFCEDESGHIFLAKITSSCALCGSEENLIAVSGKHICKECAEKITNVLH